MGEFGDQHPLALYTVGDLAISLTHLDRLEEAVHFAIQVTNDLEKCLGKAHPDVDKYRHRSEGMRARQEALAEPSNSVSGENV